MKKALCEVCFKALKSKASWKRRSKHLPLAERKSQVGSSKQWIRFAIWPVTMDTRAKWILWSIHARTAFNAESIVFKVTSRRTGVFWTAWRSRPMESKSKIYSNWLVNHLDFDHIFIVIHSINGLTMRNKMMQLESIHRKWQIKAIALGLGAHAAVAINIRFIANVKLTVNDCNLNDGLEISFRIYFL